MLNRLTKRSSADSAEKTIAAPRRVDVTSSKERLLMEAEIFRGLTPSDMQDVERMTTMTTCRKGRVVHDAGANREVLFILKKGRVQISRMTEDGRRLVMDTLEAGTVFGEMPVLSQRLQGNVAEAVEDCTLCVMSRSDLDHLVLAKPSIALNLMQVQANRIAELEERLEMQAFQSVAQRLAAVLLRLGKATGRAEGVSHQQIGETIGASRETVTRALGEFRSQGLIELGRSRVVLKDQPGLEAIAHNE